MTGLVFDVDARPRVVDLIVGQASLKGSGMSSWLQILQFLMLASLVATLVFIGYFRGRNVGRKQAEAAMRPAQDDRYQSGFRAGHFKGWIDAQASAAQAALQAPAPAPARQVPPPAPAAVQDRLWTPLAGPVRLPAPVTTPPRTAPVTAQPAVQRSSPPQVPVWSPHQESEDERRARRETRDRQNINIILYIASLLLVAAGALFLGSNLPTPLKFAGVCGITALFYITGFVLHAKVPRLRPAAVAFAGTGLALIPVVGLALYNFALQDGPISWLSTSLLGLAAYSFAAVRLESRVLAYLSLTFVISTTWSGVSVLGGALVWYFTAMIGLAILLTVLAVVRPRWLPPLYVRPLMQLHPVVVPAVAVAVTVVPLLLSRADYVQVMSLCGLYLALMAAVHGRFRLLNFNGARAALTVAGAVGIWQLTDRASSMALTVSVLLALQAFGVAFIRKPITEWFAGDKGRRNADVATSFAIQLLAAWAWVMWLQLETGNPASVLPLWLPLLAALLTGMALAVRQRAIGEWMPVAAIAATASVSPILGEWPLASFVVLSALFWLGRALRPGQARPYFVLAARSAGTLAVPLVTFAMLEGSPRRVVGALLALTLALVIQQLVSARLLRLGIPTLAPSSTLAGSTAAALIVLMAMPFVDNTLGRPLTETALLFQLVAALLIGWLLLPAGPEEAGGKGGRGEDRWQPTVGELLPMAVSLVVLPLLFVSVSLPAGNLGLLLTAAYVSATAWRLSSIHRRRAYWWLARGSWTVLALTAFEQLRDAAGPLVFGGHFVTSPLVALLVLAPQLAFPLKSWNSSPARDRLAGAMAADVAVVLGLQVMAVALLGSVAVSDGNSWPVTLGVVVVALGAAGSGIVLRRHPLAPVLAPLVLTILLLLRGGRLLDLELVLGISAVYSAVMVAAAEGRRAKGSYFVGARLLTAALAVVLSYDIAASASAVSVSLALVLAAQHVIRWLMRNRLLEIPFQQAAVWVTLGGQAALPVHYVLQGSFSSGEDSANLRWIVLLELALLLVSGVLASRCFMARGAVYLSVYAAVFGVVALGPLLGPGAAKEARAGESQEVFLAAPVLSHDGVVLFLLALALAAAAYGIFVRRRPGAPSDRNRQDGGAESGQLAPRTDVEHWLWLVASGTAALAACGLSPLADDWLAGLALLVVSALCFVASHLERLPVLYPPAAAAALAGATLMASELIPPGPEPWSSYLPWLAGCAGAAVLMYIGRWANNKRLSADPLRSGSLAGGGMSGVAFVAALGLGKDATAGTAAVLVAALAFACWLEAPPAFRRVTAELGSLAVAASIQRAVLFTGNIGPDPFWVAQWYVVLAALLAVLRYLAGQDIPARVILGSGATVLSLSGLAIVFGGSSNQQLWVLMLLAILLLTGVARNERIFVWWGAAGVTLCILWAMRQYTFALLALIAVALIIFAVWRLNRTRPLEQVVESEGPVGRP